MSKHKLIFHQYVENPTALCSPEAYDSLTNLINQNKIMREALAFYAKGFGGHPLEGMKAREALAKCGSVGEEK